MLKSFSCPMCYHLPVGPSKIESRIHRFAILFSLFGIVGQTCKLPVCERQPIFSYNRFRNTQVISAYLVAKASGAAVYKHRQLAQLVNAHRLGCTLVKDLIHFLHFKEVVARTQTSKLSCTSFSCGI